jgi:MFS family permease
MSNAPPAAPPRGGLASELGGGPFVLALIAVHLYFVAYSMSIVGVPQSLEGQPDWLIGLVVGAMGISGMVTRPLVGVWVDGGNRRRWQQLGGALTVVAYVGYAASLDPWVTIGFRFVHGIAMGLFTTAQLAIVSSMFTDRRRGLGMGLYQSANAISQMYGAPLMVALAMGVSFPAGFGAGALFSLAALGTAILIPDHEGARLAAAPARARVWVTRPAILPATVFLTMTTTVGAVQAFLPLFATERGLGNVGLFYTVWGLALLVSRALSGALSDRLGRTQVILPSLLLGAVSLVVITGARSQEVLLGAAVLYGLSFAAVQVTALALIIDRTPPESRGGGAATYTMAWDVGAVLGGILLGFVIDATSYATGFFICALLPLLGVAIYLVMPHPRPVAAVRSLEAGAVTAGDSAS